MFTIDRNGMAQADFPALEAKARKMSNDSLRFAIKDAAEAERANPEGYKAGFYLDEVNIYSDELARRRRERSL